MCAGPIRLELPTWLCGHSGVPVKHSAWSQRPQPSELQRALHRHSGPVLLVLRVVDAGKTAAGVSSFI